MALLAIVLASGCAGDDLTRCDESERPCTEPERSYCDVEGRYPAAKGQKNVCIPNPFGAWIPNKTDAGAADVQRDLRAD